MQAFNLLFILLPLTWINGFGNSYTEPKLAVLCALSILAIKDLSTLVAENKLIKFPPQLWLLVVIMFLQVIHFSEIQNAGIYLQSLTLTLSCFVITLRVLNLPSSKIIIPWMPVAFLIPLCIGGLLWVVFRIPAVSSFSTFGATIGLKNSFSVYLAQVIPLLLFTFHSLSSRKERWNATLQFLVLTLSSGLMWLVFANRTRSAWWMLFITLLTLGYLWLKTRMFAWEKLFKFYLLSMLVGGILLAIIPDALHWSSISPYYDSVMSLFSFSNSSGRNDLWRVGINMLSPFPFTGIGAGNYPALWRSYISLTEVDPTVFAFLRADLPLFNDFLQYSIENGVISGVALFILALAYPLHQFFTNPKLEILRGVALICCFITGLDAFFDYPYYRIETTAIFSYALGISLRELPTSAVVFSSKAKKFFQVLFLFTQYYMTIVLLMLTIGFLARSDWNVRGNVTSFRVALWLWPWDVQWTSKDMIELLRGGYEKDAYTLAQARMKAWPEDPESSLLWAKWYEARHEYHSAVEQYKKAVVTTSQGRCYRRGYESYLRMKSTFAVSSSALSAQDLHACEQ